MKNNLTLLSILVGLTLIFSCQKTNNLSQLEDSFTLTRNGAEMPTYVYGNANDNIFVLTLHGGPGGNSLRLRNGRWNETLEERYAMVYWDQRGSGMSQGNLNKENLNFAEMREDLKAMTALLKHKYGEDITLFLLGHSWGTMLGGGFLAEETNQDSFNGWISIASIYDWCNTIKDLMPAYTEIATEQIEANNNTVYWNEILAIAADTDTIGCDDVRLNNEAVTATDILESQGIVNSATGDFSGDFYLNNFITTTFNKIGTNDFLFDEFPFEDYDLSDKLPNIKIPSMVIHGKYDLNLALNTGQAYFDFLGSEDKTFHIFDKSAHVPMHSESEKIQEIIMEFIENYK